MIVNKISEREANNKTLRVLKKVKLQEKGNNYPYELSAEEKQKLAIARTMAFEPCIYLFDEPAFSSYPQISVDVFNIIKDLAEEGKTMIIVTHQINLIKNIANKIIFMENGEIFKSGSLEEIFN